MSNFGNNTSFEAEGPNDEMANCDFAEIAEFFTGAQETQSYNQRGSGLDALQLSLDSHSGQSTGDTRSSSDTGVTLSPHTIDTFNCPSDESCYSRVHASLDQMNSHQSAYVTQLLDCSCSKEPQLAMLSGAVMERILKSYQDARRFVYSASPSEDTQLLSPPASEHSVFSLGSVDNASLRATDFDLDDEDQETMRRLLLLSELRKIAKIIDRFSSKPLESAHDVGRAGDIYTMLGMWLRKELQEAMQNIKTKS
jgi:hypothetical protein